MAKTNQQEIMNTSAGLEVAPAGLEVADPKFWAQATPSGPYADQNDNSYVSHAVLNLDNDQRKSGRICGFLPATFFLFVALLLVIIIAGVGGGVGGTLAVNNAKK
jgi:hypothetical protein